jgi:amino-acid N-acetyltransferase
MSIIVRKARSGELPQILALIDSAELPTAGVREHLSHFVVAEEESLLLGTVGMEIYETVGLLRSLAVAPNIRGSGLGTRLVNFVLEIARENKLDAVYLLTTTADGYFPRFGFERVSRGEVDSRLHASEELRGACPQSAVCMKLLLG